MTQENPRETKRHAEQKALILAHLENRGSIDATTALFAYGVISLQRVIADLKAAGHNIVTSKEVLANIVNRENVIAPQSIEIANFANEIQVKTFVLAPEPAQAEPVASAEESAQDSKSEQAEPAEQDACASEDAPSLVDAPSEVASDVEPAPVQVI